MNKGDNILDICCGDGSCSYLFYSDIAGNIDAIDYDKNAINYAKKFYSSQNINYINEDLLHFNFKKDFYDVVIWTSSVAYFSENNRKLLLNKIYNSLKGGGMLYIKTPLEEKNSNAGSGQKETICHIVNKNNFENEFNNIFKIEFFVKSIYSDFINLNYVLKKSI
jgi:ubiquinone/menaquinone biosynthesis C-methylase UbiE